MRRRPHVHELFILPILNADLVPSLRLQICMLVLALQLQHFVDIFVTLIKLFAHQMTKNHPLVSKSLSEQPNQVLGFMK